MLLCQLVARFTISLIQFLRLITFKNRIVSHNLYSSIHKMRDRDSNSNLEWVPKLLRYNLIFIYGDNKNNLYYKKEPTLNKQ